MDATGLLSDYFTRQELAAELRVSERTIPRWEALGEAPPSVRVGRQVLYRREAVKAWLQAREKARAA